MNERDSLKHVLGKRTFVYLGILAFAFVLLLILNSSNASAETYVYQDISGSKTWNEAGSPYIVNDSIEILPGATLTIGSNVTVMVDGGEGITVSGKIIAQGTAAKWIDFTTNATSPFGYWDGLYFNSASTGSVLSYVIVQNASTGVNIVNTSVSMSNMKLVNNYFAGLEWVVNNGMDLTATLTNVEASGNSSMYTGQGMFFLVDGGNATVNILNSKAMDNYAAGIAIEATGKVNVKISDTTVSNSDNIGILAYSTTGDVVADFKNLTVADCAGFGVLVWAPNGEATVMVDPSDVSDTGDSGLQVETMGSVTLTVDDTTFTDCYVGVSVYADSGPATVDLTNVSFSGCTNGLVVDVTNGDAIIDVDKTVMGAPEDGGFVNYYPVEIEAEYDIINPVDYTGSVMDVVLPFDFPYAGGVYDEVWVYAAGIISVGAPGGGPFPVDIYSSSANMIIPCQDYFTADAWPYVGYKVYDDRIVFQWYVWATSGPSYLKDVFEVVLYPSGDIQFNYADMETMITSGYSYDYGLVTDGYLPIRLNDIMAPNVYDMDYTSVYFSMEQFNGGWGIIVEAMGSVTATVTDSSISHYFYGGAALISLDSWVSVEVMNSSFEYFMNWGLGYGAGLQAIAYNGTITATLEDSTFGHALYMGVGLFSMPMWGGEDAVTVTNCTFEEIGYYSMVIYTSVYDYDGFNEIVNYASTRTITENMFENAAGIFTYTYIEAYDSAWNVSMSETMTNNTFIGSPPFAFILGEPAAAPLDGLYMGLLTSYSEVVSLVDGAQVEKTAVVTGNNIEAPLWMGMGPEGAPLQGGMFGISIEDSVIAVDGPVTWVETVTVTDNVLNATDGYFDEAIYVEMYGIVIDGELNSTLMADVSNNDLLAESWLGWEGIDVEIWQYCEEGLGNGTIAADIVIEKNLIQNVWWAIYVYVDASVYDQWGDQTADFSVSVVDNEITGDDTYGGIEVEVYGDCEYNGYFPPYETEVSSSQTTTYAVEITNNVLQVYSQGIYTYLESNVREDSYGVFTQAALDLNGTWNISANEINLPDTGWYGIWTDFYESAEIGEAAGVWTAEVLISDNTIAGPMDGYITYGIYVYENPVASTYDMRFDDTPTAVSTFSVAITGNDISQAWYNVYAYSDVGSYYGLSSVTSDSSIVITDNVATGVYSIGIYVDVSAGTTQYTYDGYATNAIATVTSMVDVSGNMISWTDEEYWPYGVEVDVDFSDSEILAEQVMLDVMVEITANTITGTGGGESDGIDAGANSPMAGVFVISDNVIDLVGYGIYVWDANLTISDNAMTNLGEDGIYIDDCIGTVSGNTVTGALGDGIYVEYSELLTIENNVLDQCDDGIYLYETVDTVVTGNTMTNNGLMNGDTYGLYVYDCYNITVSENEITGNLYGMYVEYTDLMFVSDNTVNGNEHGGAGFYESNDLMIEGNTFSENGGDGVWMYYCDAVIFSNNTANENSGYGLNAYSYYSGFVLTIYNGEYAENTYEGLYVEMEYSGADWIVDAASEVRNNGVYFDGDVTVVSGGVLTLDTVNDFVMGWDYRDGRAKITVDEGGKLVVMNSVIGEEYMDGIGPLPDGFDYYEFNVLGTLDMESSTVADAKELYLGPTSSASIRTSTIAYNFRNGIHIDDCSPVISGTTIAMNNMDGIFIEGANAAPKITDCLITMNERGVYAYKSNLANVVDNLIVLNDVAGIYAYDSDGKIHDNILLFNKREIWIKDSTVSVQSNQIGYSVLVGVMVKYLPLLSMNFEVPISDGFEISPELMMMMMLDHIGIYAENSTVSASDNVYGMLTYAVYVVDSQLTFSDSVKATQLVIPYFDSVGMLWNITVPIYVYDGIYASGSSLTVNGGYIEVLDDAIFLENSTADLRNVVLNATDMDLYLMDGSTASATNVTFDGGILVEDTSALTVNYKLTVIAVDQDGQPVGGVWIVIRDAAGEVVAEGATGDDGMFVTYVVGYVQTSAGKSAAMNPYLVNASFDQGSVLKSVTVDGPTEVTVQIPVEKVKPIEMAPIVAVTLLAIVLMVMLLLTIRGRP
jgi:parallel beta-helix repeat protein